MFEAVRSGFDGRVAVDDVMFLERPCTIPRMCSFEGQRCGYSSSGKVHWLHRNGHTATTTGPKTDHTLETKLGQKKSWQIEIFNYCCLFTEKKRNQDNFIVYFYFMSRLLHDGWHRQSHPSHWCRFCPHVPCSTGNHQNRVCVFLVPYGRRKPWWAKFSHTTLTDSYVLVKYVLTVHTLQVILRCTWSQRKERGWKSFLIIWIKETSGTLAMAMSRVVLLAGRYIKTRNKSRHDELTLIDMWVT